MSLGRGELAEEAWRSVQGVGRVLETGKSVVVEREVVFVLRPVVEEGGRVEAREDGARAGVTGGRVTVGPSAKAMW